MVLLLRNQQVSREVLAKSQNLIICYRIIFPLLACIWGKGLVSSVLQLSGIKTIKQGNGMHNYKSICHLFEKLLQSIIITIIIIITFGVWKSA
jgi:hypothetical protein